MLLVLPKLQDWPRCWGRSTGERAWLKAHALSLVTLSWKAAVSPAQGGFTVHWFSLWTKVGSDGAEAWVGGLHYLAGESCVCGGGGGTCPLSLHQP